MCTSCRAANGYYLNNDPTSVSYKNCIYITVIADGWGADQNATSPTYGQTVKCQDVNCKMCTQNYQVCTACDIANKWYLNTTDKYCYQESTLASKTGANVQSSNTSFYGKIVPCVDLKCLNCQANYLDCTGCDVSANYFLQGTKCILDTTIPTSYGANREQTSST